MAVLVKNEDGGPYVLKGSFGSRSLDAGTTQMLSDEEWASVPSNQRGPGYLNPQPLPVNASVSANVTPSPAYALAIRVDDVGGSPTDITYVGEADPGSLTSAAVWRIKRLSTDTEFTTTEWAGTGAFDQIWDDRVSLTYS